MKVEEIRNRLVLMTYEVVEANDIKGYKESRKVAEIVTAVACGSSKSSRLVTADKILKKWGF